MSDKAETLRELIYSTNEKYAASHGEDLFKMTNASAAALAKLAVAAKDVEQYGDLIDALYKIIYEGSGACKRLPTPPPEFAMEVKHLRTVLRHDVDHGDAAAASKKRKLAARIFAKYSGKQTPGECGSDEFLAAQLRLLGAAADMIKRLS